MILADKIITLRKKNGWSQEELAEQLQVSRQSVSKWESAQSIPDMNKILMMSEIFGVSTDVLLKEEMEIDDHEAVVTVEPTTAVVERETLPTRPVSMEEANEYLKDVVPFAKSTAWGVSFCIASPIFLIVMATLQEQGYIALKEAQAVGCGLLVLFALIIAAVAIFVINGQKYAKWDFLDKEFIDTAYGVDGMVKERREAYSSRHITELVVGIVLCICSVVPLFIMMMIFGEDGRLAETMMEMSMAIVLAFVSVGVHLIVDCSVIWDGFHRLLEEGDYTRESKTVSNNPWMKGYWLLVTALYLGISFYTMRWDITWIIWLVAAAGGAVLYAFTNKR